jgi:hemoglobin
MIVRHDIQSIEDIKLLVNTFYDKVRADVLLSPVFNEKINDRWPQHLGKMYSFWQTVLLGEPNYHGSPFPPHATLPVDHAHFEQWLRLFTNTIVDLFSGDKADEALWRANKMAEMFEMKIMYYRDQQVKTLV